MLRLSMLTAAVAAFVFATSTASAYRCRGHAATTQSENRSLVRGDFLCAAEYRFGLDEDGYVRLLRLSPADVNNMSWETIWEAQQEVGGDALHFQSSDGNLVLYKQEQPLWASNSAGAGADKLVLFPSGEVRITTTADDSLTIWNPEGLNPEWNCLSDTLRSGEKLLEGQYICDGNVTLGFAHGNLRAEEFYLRYGGYWSDIFVASQVTTKYSDFVHLQEDGNLVMKYQARPSWSMRTDGNIGATLGLYEYGPKLRIGPGDDYTNFVSLHNPKLVCKGRNLKENARSYYGARLFPGERLYSGEVLCNEDRFLGIDNTGDFAYWDKLDRNEKVWSANTGPRNPQTGGYDTYVEMKNDGNLVVYANGDIEIWRTNFPPNENAMLHLDDRYSGVWIQKDEGNRYFRLFNDDDLIPPSRCLPKPVSAGQRFERDDMICDSFAHYGLDIDGRLTKTVNIYYIDQTWGGSFTNLGGEFADHAYWQGDGNFVVNDKNGRTLWSSRTESKDLTKQPTLDIQCYSRAICPLEYDLEVVSTRGCRGSEMKGGDRLYAEQMICAGNYRFGLDEYGTASIWVRERKAKVLAPQGRESWSYSNRIEMQKGDGNLVLRDFSGNPLWSSGTSNEALNKDATLRIDESGLLRVYAANGTLVKEIKWRW